MSGLWRLSGAKLKKIRRFFKKFSLPVMFLTPKPRVYILISLLCIMLEQALADSLKSVIPSMVNALLSSGLNVSMDLDELYKKDDLLS